MAYDANGSLRHFEAAIELKGRPWSGVCGADGDSQGFHNVQVSKGLKNESLGELQA